MADGLSVRRVLGMTVSVPISCHSHEAIPVPTLSHDNYSFSFPFFPIPLFPIPAIPFPVIDVSISSKYIEQ